MTETAAINIRRNMVNLTEDKTAVTAEKKPLEPAFGAPLEDLAMDYRLAPPSSSRNFRAALPTSDEGFIASAFFHAATASRLLSWKPYANINPLVSHMRW